MGRRSKRRISKISRSYSLPRTLQKSRPRATLLRKRNDVPYQFAAVPLQISPKRRTRLDSSVLASPTRTVRRPLIRTVLRDTKRPLPRHLRPANSPSMLSKTLRWWSPSIEPFGPIAASIDASQHPMRLTEDLNRATVCARRSMRREVLHALRQLNGSGGRGKPKSKQRC